MESKVGVWRGGTGRESPEHRPGKCSSEAEARSSRFGRELIPEYLLLSAKVYDSAKGCTCAQAASPAALRLKPSSKVHERLQHTVSMCREH